ncbi:cyclic-phosphate processing receiver domain-containing protein [Paenibacillus sp. JSM ZJ436]|uniref:cyclic-phosphate processing receiver domain-containing protein n=1 Tax=Paenibacillus sp. JSM ZJ436 TaxID=3376190 RepID=UPI00378A0140
MIHVYLDDWRACPPGFALARNGEECLMLLRECKVGILSLDYELGPDVMNGGDVAAAIVREQLYPEEIFLHTSSPSGRTRMYEMLYQHKPPGVKVHHGPMPADYLKTAGYSEA